MDIVEGMHWAGYETPSSFGERIIAQLRKGETFASLASRSGVNKDLIAQYIYHPGRRPATDTLTALAEILHLSVDEIAHFSYDPLNRTPKPAESYEQAKQTVLNKDPDHYKKMASKAGKSRSPARLSAATNNLKRARAVRNRNLILKRGRALGPQAQRTPAAGKIAAAAHALQTAGRPLTVTALVKQTQKMFDRSCHHTTVRAWLEQNHQSHA